MLVCDSKGNSSVYGLVRARRETNPRRAFSKETIQFQREMRVSDAMKCRNVLSGPRCKKSQTVRAVRVFESIAPRARGVTSGSFFRTVCGRARWSSHARARPTGTLPRRARPIPATPRVHASRAPSRRRIRPGISRRAHRVLLFSLRASIERPALPGPNPHAR